MRPSAISFWSLPFVTSLFVGCSHSTEPKAPPNFALDFNQSYVNVPDNNALDLTTSWTLEAWVYPRASGNGADQDIISKWDGAPDASYIMQIDRTGALRMVTNNGSSQTIALSNALLTNNTWQHVAATFQGTNVSGTLKLYVNGVLDKTVTNALTPINSTQPLAFGREGNVSGGTLNGIIDEVRLWNIVRTDAEIASNRSVRLSGTETGLAGLWRFDEGSGDVVLDSSGRGNNGRLGTTIGTDAWDPKWTPNAAPIP
jgi:Concanavalin A-like lectin/glucanases superfamily